MKGWKSQLAALAAVALSVGGASAAEYELKMSSMFPSTHFVQKLALQPWADMIEERSDGRVTISFFAAGSAFGDATRQFDQVRSGVVDFSIGIPGIPRGRHQRTVLIELPFTVPDSKVGTCALMSMKDTFQPDFPGAHILLLTVTEPSAVHTVGEVATLDDLSGLRMRTPTPAITALLEEIGSTPVGMPPTEIYESVERGVVDGNIMPWGPVGAFKLHEVLNYHIDAKINPVSMYILMNEAKYNEMPEDLQTIIDEASAEVFANWPKWWVETDQAAIDAAKAAGNTIIEMPDEDRNAWRDRLQPVIDGYLAEKSGLPAEEAEALYSDILASVKTCE